MNIKFTVRTTRWCLTVVPVNAVWYVEDAEATNIYTENQSNNSRNSVENLIQFINAYCIHYNFISLVIYVDICYLMLMTLYSCHCNFFQGVR